MNTKEIAKKIRNDYRIIKSLGIKYVGVDYIDIVGMEYDGKKENFATDKQINFLLSLSNVSSYRNNLEKANKWFVSACIEIAKDYPECTFEISV